MKKTKIIIGIIIFLGLMGIGGSIYFITNLNGNKKQQDIQTVANRDVKIELITELSFEINSELNIDLLISKDNQLEIINKDEKIDTSVLGEKEITIKYINAEEEEQEEKVKIMILDTIAPKIEYEKELSTIVNKEIDLLKNVKVTDNSNEEVKAVIEGNYNFKKEGIYKLKYIAIDSSENRTEEEFILKVTAQSTQSITNSTIPSNDIKDNDKKTANQETELNTNTNNTDNYSTNIESDLNNTNNDIYLNDITGDFVLEPPLTCTENVISIEEFTNIVPEFTLTDVSSGFDFQVKLPPSVGGKPVHKKSCVGLYIKTSFIDNKTTKIKDMGGIARMKVPYGLFKEGKNIVKIALYSYDENGKEIYSKFSEKEIEVHFSGKK